MDTTCELCGIRDSTDACWRVRVCDADSISAGPRTAPVDLSVCPRCAGRAADAVEALRKALV